MTATNDAPDTHGTATAEERWQHIEDRLTAIERRIRETGSTALATLDACLGRLDALRHDLTHQPRPSRPRPSAVSTPPQESERSTHEVPGPARSPLLSRVRADPAPEGVAEWTARCDIGAASAS